MTTFRNFHVVQSRLEFDPRFAKTARQSSPVGDTVHRALMLVEAATDLFTGCYPLEAPYFELGDRMTLPWFKEYHVLKGKTWRRKHLDLRELAAIANEILLVNEHEPTDPGRWTALAERLLETSQGHVQGFAVETVLHVDSFLDCVGDDRPSDALPWISAAHEAFSEAVCRAQVTLCRISLRREKQPIRSGVESS
jgi:hypothetical protein